jgi:hypothetical protein
MAGSSPAMTENRRWRRKEIKRYRYKRRDFTVDSDFTCENEKTVIALVNGRIQARGRQSMTGPKGERARGSEPTDATLRRKFGGENFSTFFGHNPLKSPDSEN